MDFYNNKPTAQMLGRWQPWHQGHTELFKRIRSEYDQIWIAVRNVQGWEDNPFDYHEIRENINLALFAEGFRYAQDYEISLVPNIVNISYGRGVGYTFTEHDLGTDIHNISATKIRAEMREKGKL